MLFRSHDLWVYQHRELHQVGWSSTRIVVPPDWHALIKRGCLEKVFNNHTCLNILNYQACVAMFLLSFGNQQTLSISTANATFLTRQETAARCTRPIITTKSSPKGKYKLSSHLIREQHSNVKALHISPVKRSSA